MVEIRREDDKCVEFNRDTKLRSMDDSVRRKVAGQGRMIDKG